MLNAVRAHVENVMSDVRIMCSDSRSWQVGERWQSLILPREVFGHAGIFCPIFRVLSVKTERYRGKSNSARYAPGRSV